MLIFLCSAMRNLWRFCSDQKWCKNCVLKKKIILEFFWPFFCLIDLVINWIIFHPLHHNIKWIQISSIFMQSFWYAQEDFVQQSRASWVCNHSLFFLTTFVFNLGVILLGEIRCWCLRNKMVKENCESSKLLH